MSRSSQQGFTSLQRSAQQGFTHVRRSAQQGFTSLQRSAQQGFTHVRRSAQQGFTSLQRSAQQGFTLVELMVVLLIVGLMSGAVLMVMPDPKGRLTDDAERFAGRVKAAHDRAIVLGRPVAVWVSASGYGFEERRDGRWNPLDEPPLSATDWPRDAQAQTGSGRARISFDTIGRADQPLTFRIARDGRGVSLEIGLDGRTRIGS